MELSDKAVLRRRIRELVRALTADERAAFSKNLCDTIRTQLIWQQSASVLCFASLADEPDVTSLINEAVRGNKTVALPRFDSTSASYTVAQVTDHSQLIPGRFGALEPAAGCPLVPLNQLDLALVPGVAFDSTGRRLGRGKGFYDRLLAEVRGHKCGVAFDAQIVAEVPEELHDVRVDSILTPTRWQLCLRAA